MTLFTFNVTFSVSTCICVKGGEGGSVCVCARAWVYDSLLQQELPLGVDIFVLVKVFWLQCSFACLSLSSCPQF